MKRALLSGLAAFLVAAAVVGVVMAAGSRTSAHADLTIRHASVGCHVWALGGGAGRTAQTLVLRVGQSFTVTNRDNCGHSLVQTSGPSNALAGAKTIESLGAPLRVALYVPGVYSFTTSEHEDYAYGATEAQQNFGFAKLTSGGMDNTLTLRVRVLPDRTPTD